jgi:hypothetical protein
LLGEGKINLGANSSHWEAFNNCRRPILEIILLRINEDNLSQERGVKAIRKCGSMWVQVFQPNNRHSQVILQASQKATTTVVEIWNKGPTKRIGYSFHTRIELLLRSIVEQELAVKSWEYVDRNPSGRVFNAISTGIPPKTHLI